MNLFVANVSREVKEDTLKALFSEYGEVSSVQIVTDRITGNSKGFGFIEMPDDHSALQAIKKLTHMNFFGLNLVITKARPKNLPH